MMNSDIPQPEVIEYTGTDQDAMLELWRKDRRKEYPDEVFVWELTSDWAQTDTATL